MSLTVDKIQSLAEEIHSNAVDKGFWDGDRNLNEARMLIITELAEAVEAHRENREAFVTLMKIEEEDIKSDEQWKILFENNIKDTVEDEFADAYIRVLDLLYHETEGKVGEEFSKEKIKFGYIFTNNFAETIYNICKLVMEDLSFGLFAIEILCKREDIDLEWHVEQKMKYNSMREKMHGKKY